MARADERWGGFARPVAIAVTSGVALAGSLLVASRRPGPDWELRLTEWINDAPDAVASTLYAVMQLGTMQAHSSSQPAVSCFDAHGCSAPPRWVPGSRRGPARRAQTVRRA